MGDGVVGEGACGFFCFFFLFNEDGSSLGEREVTLCPGRWVEKAPGWGDLGKGRGWPKAHGQPGILLR